MKTEWWLDESALPRLYWARLQVFKDGHCRITDCDARDWRFENLRGAELWLAQEEYLPFSELRKAGEVPEATQPPAWT